MYVRTKVARWIIFGRRTQMGGSVEMHEERQSGRSRDLSSSRARCGTSCCHYTRLITSQRDRADEGHPQ